MPILKTSCLSQHHSLKGSCDHRVHCPQVTDEGTRAQKLIVLTLGQVLQTPLLTVGSTACYLSLLLRGRCVGFSELGAVLSPWAAEEAATPLG